MKHEPILRKALAAAVRALERITEGADAQATAEPAISAAKDVLEQTATPEEITPHPTRLHSDAGRALPLRKWSWRYSAIRGKEGEICQTVYDADGKPVCRVLPTKSGYTTRQRVVCLAAAPEMLSALTEACHYMRSSGACVYPSCDTCRIGKILQRIEETLS